MTVAVPVFRIKPIFYPLTLNVEHFSGQVNGLGEERLQKILAQAGIASRRRAEEMIRAGRVKIDGQLVDKLGVKVNPALNKVEINGKPVLLKTKRVYLAFYKPVGVVTTAHDPQGRPKISDFLSEISERVFPAGRLDLDSEGLLLLTNDGQLAYRLTHPRYKVPKIYDVSVSGAVSDDTVKILENGVPLEDGLTQPSVVELVRREKNRTHLRITLKEGRKRQVRRMCEAVGHPVLSLKRIAIGPLRLGRLKPGEYRHLSVSEIARLKRHVGLQ